MVGKKWKSEELSRLQAAPELNLPAFLLGSLVFKVAAVQFVLDSASWHAMNVKKTNQIKKQV